MAQEFLNLKNSSLSGILEPGGYVVPNTVRREPINLRPFAYSDHSRRAWVRTVDDIGLFSEPAGLSINLGDTPVENVVLDMRESERLWPGTITNGVYLAGEPLRGII